MYTKTPMQQYSRQKAAAKIRGIEWCFSFDSWMALWITSGKFDQRGFGPDDYVMARNGDIGPYSKANVRIIPMRENCKEAHSNKPPRDSLTVALYSLGKGRGWTPKKKGFQVVVSRKYIGLFKTTKEAEIAYKKACAARALEISA